MEAVAPRIWLRPIGSPLAIGMSGLTIASLVQSGFDLGWTSRSEAAALSAVAVSTTKPLPAGVFLLASLRFSAAGVYELSSATAWVHVAGVSGLAVTAAAAYCVLAF